MKDRKNAEKALRAYTGKYMGTTTIAEIVDEDGTQIADLITDLLHLAHLPLLLDVNAILQTATSNFEAEIGEES